MLIHHLTIIRGCKPAYTGHRTCAASAALVVGHTHTLGDYELGRVLCFSLPLHLKSATFFFLPAAVGTCTELLLSKRKAFFHH